MNIELQKQRNDLLYRTNIVVKVINNKTPSRVELLKKIAATLGCDERLIVVDKIDQEYGTHSSLAYVKLYDDFKHLKDIELNYKIKRTGEIEEVKEEAKAETKEKVKVEAKAEVKKEVKEETK
jgi:small subunit ribosomal protein S24e